MRGRQLKQSKISALAAITISVLFFSCSATKFLKEDESFFAGSEIKFETNGKKIGGKKVLQAELEEYIRPKPNAKFLGSRPDVWLYFIAGTPKKEKGGLRNFIKNKLGNPPVLLKDIKPEPIARSMTTELSNEGYFRSSVSTSVKTKKKESTVIFHVDLKPPYFLDTIAYPSPRDSTYARIIRGLEAESLLAPKQRYDLEMLQAEQGRIEQEVEDVGFYYFDDRYLIFEADSTEGDHQVDLRLRLEKNIPPRARQRFRLNDVYVLPSFSLVDSLKNSRDTVMVDRYHYISSSKQFRPEIITGVINLEKGNLYSRTAHDLTLSHLMDLGNFKYVNIKYRTPRTDTALLDAYVYLTPLLKKSIRGEMQAVSKSNNFVGPGVSVTFTNRNFLRGAEQFKLQVTTSYEVQVSRRQQGALNAFELGLESSLTIPRFITPFNIDYSSKRYLPKTQLKLAFNLQNRLNYFRLSSFNAGAGYLWRESETRSHELFPIDFNFVRTDKTSPEFDTLLLNNPFLAASFENQFITGTRYSFTYNSQLKQRPGTQFKQKEVNKHNFYFNGNVDVAGNLLNAVQKQIRSEDGPYKIFGSAYSQYVRGDIDVRYYWQVDIHNKVATRLILGSGYAYGNSTVMPYIKQFAVGGSNSLRAFPARSVGPGTYNVFDEEALEGNALFVDQRGDIRIEGNVEYRFDIYQFFKGAVFMDAGNIWVWNEDSREGGGFTSDFYKQFAVGTGLGFRFDFNFFVLRFDLAFPVRKPWLEESPWVWDEIDFGSGDWRAENLVLNIAIGYPF